MQRTVFNFQLALQGVFSNKLRAFLTALGIIFGVGAVIAMLAIGKGAEQAILEQMELIGTNNIVVKGIVLSEEEKAEEVDQEDKKPWSPGLSLKDVDAIEQIIPTIEKSSPELVLPTSIIQSGKIIKGKCVGVTNTFFELNNLQVGNGKNFHFRHIEEGRPVCIIGKNIQTRFFNRTNPIGQILKCGNVRLEVIGVLDRLLAEEENLTKLGIRDYNDDVFVPITTALVRFKNRAFVTKENISRGNWDNEGGDKENYHQIDRVVFKVDETKNLRGTADVIAEMLKRRHRDMVDFEVEVPEILIQQQRKTQDTFNWVLAAIAAISLLVGGIGIMNIMLASVLERIKEIGVRRSLGAKRSDIVSQFLFEAVFISLIGGIVGVLLGVLAARIISSSAGIPTVVSTGSIILSFSVAAAVGLAFGLFPARKAARQDPIKALRSE